MRPDSFVLGNNPEAGKEEKVEGCSKCHRTWPAVRFSRHVAALQIGEIGIGGEFQGHVICDSCWPSELSKEIAQKIDEATGAQPAASVLVRSVMVMGIESSTNIVGFQFPTHVRGEELTLTDIQVTFKGKQSAEIAPCPVYVYKNVPLIIAQVWCEAPSHGQSFGSYFIEQIKNSYAFERKV